MKRRNHINFFFNKVKSSSKGNIPFDKKELVTFLNPYSYLLYRKHTLLFKNFDTIHIDGIFLVTLLRLIGISVKRKSFDMTSLAPEIFKYCSEYNKTIYFVGSKAKEINKFVEVIKSAYPKLKILGFRDGYFLNLEDQNKTINKIKMIHPDVLVAGMGTPYQEKFLVSLRESGWLGKGYTCGGFIHQTANGLKYYPRCINKYNLRWLYRIYDEPKLFKRYFFHYPISICLFTFDAIIYKFCKK